jgi:hypothetical protein
METGFIIAGFRIARGKTPSSTAAAAGFPNDPSGKNLARS